MEWKVNENANTFARNLRRAIDLAKSTPEYRRYGLLTVDYKICVFNDIVRVEYRRAEFIEETKKLQLVRQIVNDPYDLTQIVGYLVENNPSEVHFTQVRLSSEDMVKLYKHCVMNKLYIIDHEEAGITVTITDKNNLHWSPLNK